MTATDELRHLLDERGVEYDGAYDTTFWEGSDGTAYMASEIYSLQNQKQRTKRLLLKRTATPEQAIAATLGREPDDAAMVKLHDRMNAALFEYERAQGIEQHEGDSEVVVPWVVKMHALLEEAATLGAGTCRRVRHDGDAVFQYCSECGGMLARWLDYDNGNAHFCPNCGRKVVDE